MLRGRELFLKQHPSCTRSMGAGGFWGWKQGVCSCTCGCGSVWVRVDLSPNGQDKEEEQVPSNAKGYSGSAQPWRRFGTTEERHGAPLTSPVPFLGMESE